MSHSTHQEETRWRTRWYVAPLVDAHNIERKRRKCKLADGRRWSQEARGGIGKGAKRSAKPAGRCRAMTLRSVYGSDVDQLYATHERMYVRHYAMRESTYLPWRNSMTGWSSILCVATKSKHYLVTSCKSGWRSIKIHTVVIIANLFNRLG